MLYGASSSSPPGSDKNFFCYCLILNREKIFIRKLDTPAYRLSDLLSFFFFPVFLFSFENNGVNYTGSKTSDMNKTDLTVQKKAKTCINT